ncbi:MAG: hypothetical protein A2091_13120 [Desulfuromonadales bacterium GWD2_61_12]|nr:MAG: hypothetical protein A2005_01120 [Desulfuromonadales bacterium GWC2_61_20]OGR35447.1 MAG: hypothetical protein A2091_13120 [Desulfuromonadales bacterium GWD2_61_12]
MEETKTHEHFEQAANSSPSVNSSRQTVAKSKSIFFTNAFCQCFKFQSIRHPLLRIQGAIDVQDLIFRPELQLVSILEGKSIYEYEKKISNFLFRSIWKFPSPIAPLAKSVPEW